jgi:electron transport complex protein RnfB
MTPTDDVYERLAAHLDRLPAGFPRTPGGVELRILRRLFTPEEAELAVLLDMRPEKPARIAAKAGLNAEALADKLYGMSKKGLIFRIRKGEEVLYMPAQFVIGIWEYHVNDLDPDLIRDFNEYLPALFRGTGGPGTPQLRTIPVSGAITAEPQVMPYEEARKIVLEQDQIAVAPCICRKERHLMGEGCDRLLESCLVFGMGAQYYEENGIGRRISREEAFGILEEAERTGLVLQPSNAQKTVNMCLCCGCCCGILRNLKKAPKPALYTASNYYAVIDPDLCSACGVCGERCQMDAVTMGEGGASVSRDRCIGCGLCVPTCPEEAIRLEVKPEQDRHVPPAHLKETYKKIAAERMKRSGGS